VEEKLLYFSSGRSISNPGCTRANHLSRKKMPLYGWALPWKWFNYIRKQWEFSKFKIDAFAARRNKKLPVHWNQLPGSSA
jgi:hypothetical protein